MGLPKGASKIRLGAVEYRWLVSPDSGAMVIVVQLATGKGKRLREVVGYDVEVTPGVVRKIILEALKQGWDFENGKRSPEKRTSNAAPRSSREKPPGVPRKGDYRCPVCSALSLHHNPEGFFACGSCSRTFLPSELRHRLKS